MRPQRPWPLHLNKMMLFKKKPYDFHGGIAIPSRYLSNQLPIIKAPLPKQVVIPLLQSTGVAKPLLKVGDHVYTGQAIACNQDDVCTTIHASISGTISAIEQKAIIGQSQQKTLTITINSDGKDEYFSPHQTIQNPWQMNAEALIKRIQKSGVVGMGGAGFPTFLKIKTAVHCHTLIINGTECEPDVSCDDVLMQSYSKEIIEGIELLRYITGAKKVIVAVEDDKTKALALLKAQNNNKQITFVTRPIKYGSGAEKILIKTLLGIELPSGSYAANVGVLCHNIATVKAIYDVLIKQQPLISRVITVTGNAIKKPHNYLVRIGTPIKTLIDLCQPSCKNYGVRTGGMMMGTNIDNVQVPVNKTTNAIFVQENKAVPIAQPCIRCGQCNEVCPVNLLPQQLYWYAKSGDIDKTMDYHLLDCIECNCCTYVCPSNIPLVSHYQEAKSHYHKQQFDKQKASLAKQRFDFRNERLLRNKEEKKALMEEKRKALQKKLAQDASAKEKIQAALKKVSHAK